jgi:nitrogen regulatory protein P-II 1
MMTKLEAIIQPSKLDAVKEALSELGVDGLTISEVRGHGRQKGHAQVYRGAEYTVDLIPKVKLEIIAADSRAEEIVATLIAAAKTGKIGDGKVFVSNVEEAVRIRTEEKGNQAV